MVGERADFTPPTFAAIASALNVSMEWLISGQGRSPEPTGPVPPRLPYLVVGGDDGDHQPDALRKPVDVARMLLEEAARERPNASVLELLVRAQTLAIERRLVF
jgi:hypothetical protein